jgi:hypothetical protein
MHTNCVGATIVQNLVIMRVAHTTRIMHILYNQGPRARIKMKKNPSKHKLKKIVTP